MSKDTGIMDRDRGRGVHLTLLRNNKTFFPTINRYSTKSSLYDLRLIPLPLPYLKGFPPLVHPMDLSIHRLYPILVYLLPLTQIRPSGTEVSDRRISTLW